MIDIKKIYRLSFSKAAKTYEEEAFIQRQTAKVISDKVKNLEGVGLDCGCGTCFINDFLPQKRIVNLDISKPMAEICKNKGYFTLVADIEKMPFKDHSFDYAVSNFTLHWTDLLNAFSEVSRVLKDRGVFVFSIPVVGSLSVIEDIVGRSFFEFEEEGSITEKLSYSFCVEEQFTQDFYRDMEDGVSFLKHLHLTGSMVNPKEISMREKLNIVRAFSQYKKPVRLNFRVAFFVCRKI